MGRGMRSTLVDFVGREQRRVFDPPVRSLMDIDFYKFTMGQMIFKNFKDVQVTFELINRDKGIPLASIVSENELRKYLDYTRSIRFTSTEMAQLRGMRVYGANMFSEEYMAFLENFQLPPYALRRHGDQYKLTFSGAWAEVSMWETIALAIISELYYRHLKSGLSMYELDVLYARAKSKLWGKLERLSQYPGIRYADFGQRRRHSFLWQDWAISAAKETNKEQLTGTSNTLLAFRHNITPVGTNAHELPMVLVALAHSEEEKRAAQYKVLEYWQELYGEGLRIFLPDTYGTAQFFASAPEWLAHTWRGMRQDSGNPIRVAHAYMKWLSSYGVNPREKVVIFSDGLDVDPMIQIYKELVGQINTGFGWGTLFTNDFLGCCPKIPFFRPFSLICKPAEVNGVPAVKLPDNLAKATGPAEEVERYLCMFGSEGRAYENVIV